ncbi:hypothetical protein FA15DRAFT_516702 [Coprinopsis marcescibilis]|uniref:Uncharacterized protein n=1 Tax=Coprinopsis marcescibilis TaxID=230819 RepID=A0A5C3KPM8_COPMA|nr:hypothetical protein FA15DRAFT_516702 [Coprinopsis marcescibilis]
MVNVLRLHRRQNLPPVVSPVRLPPPTASDVFPLFISIPTPSTIQTASKSPLTDSSLSSASSDVTSVSSTSSSAASSISTDSGARHLIPIKLGYLIPTVALMGLIVMTCVIWSCYRCCSRKPRESLDDAEAERGPRYSYINDEVGYGRWTGDDRPVEKSHSMHYHPSAVDDGSAWTQSSAHFLETHPNRDDRARYGDSVGAWDDAGGQKVSEGERLNKPGSFSRQQSKTSEAFREMYESDDDQASIRREDVPYENLRHKSIKRGILSQVKEESNWMDSLRAVAGSVFVNQAPTHPVDSYTRRRGTTLRDDGPVRRKTGIKPGHEWIDEGRKRRANLSMKSTNPVQRKATAATTCTQAESHTALIDDEANPVAWSPQTGFKIIEESPPNTPPLRETSTTTSSTAQDPMVSILPISPPQIMSPPLESELCFTPPPTNAPGPSLQEIAEYVVESGNRKGKGKRSIRSCRPVNVDDLLPDPRALSGGVQMTKQAKSRNRLFKKRSTLKAFRYETLPC